MRRLHATLALVVATGCYGPKPQAGSSCASAPCPTGLVCSPASETCELVAVDAATDSAVDGPALDGPPLDAMPLDAPQPPQAMLVQQTTATSATMEPSLSVGLPAATTDGDVLVMIGGTPAGSLMSVTGGGASTWSRATSSTENYNIEVWFGRVDVASTSPITIAQNGATGHLRLWVGEWRGLAVPVLRDGEVASAGMVSPAQPPPITTPPMARDLVILGVADGAPNTFGVPEPDGWTALVPVTLESTVQVAWYRIYTAPVTVTATVAETAHKWDAALVAFRIAE